MHHQFIPLDVRDASHKRQVIVSAPFVAAHGGPRADVAMINPLRIVGRRERVVIALDDGFQAAPKQSEVRSVIVDAVRLYGSVIVWRNDIEVFWDERLNAREQIAVEAQLKNRAGARIDGQLGVGYFVAPWA
jgi:hypothetical protein